MLSKVPDMRALKKRYILLVSKECEPCEEAKRDFATKHFGYGEIIDVESREGLKLANDHEVTFVPLELELDNW